MRKTEIFSVPRAVWASPTGLYSSGAPTNGKSKKLSQGIFARETISSLAFCLRMTCNVDSRLLGVDQNSRSDSAIVGVIMGSGTAQVGARWTLWFLENKVLELNFVDRASDSTISIQFCFCEDPMRASGGPGSSILG
jgi:hypothetical protein